MRKKEDGREALVNAMRSLEKTCNMLEKSYISLQERVAAMQKELDRREMLLDALFSNIPIGVFLVSADGTVKYRNALAGKLCGGKDGKKNPNLSYSLGAKTAKKLTSADPERPIKEDVIKKGGVWEVTSLAIGADSPAREFIVLMKDIREKVSERNAEEIRKRFQSLGETAAIVAHEIRNPLGSMELFASILEDKLEGDPDGLHILGRIRTGLSSIEQTVANYLLFAKPREITYSSMPLGKLIREIADFCRPSAQTSGIEINTDVPDNINLRGDAQMLKQVFLNLAINSMQAMPDGGRLSIAARRKGGKVAITFSDTGIGIKRKDIPRVFDPFFTTKEKGTGLGLAITHNIVTAHGGTISVSSGRGKETTFRLELETGK